MGGKSRKSGGVSEKLIARIKGNKCGSNATKSNCNGKGKSRTDSLFGKSKNTKD